MLMGRPERIHRKVLRKVKKNFVTVTLVGGLVAAVGTEAVSAEETGAATGNEVGPADDDGLVDDKEAPVGEDDGVGEGEKVPEEDSSTPGDEDNNDALMQARTQDEAVVVQDEEVVANEKTITVPEVPERPEGTRRATIIHTNDIHGRINHQGESDYDLGMGHIKSIADAYRELSDEVILLDAGDAVHGTTSVNLSEGENMIELMNELGYKALSPGNHEFNYGSDKLKELEELAEFDFIASNIEDENGDQLFNTFTEWQVFGESIGIIGVGSQETRTTTHPNNIENITFTDEVDAVKGQINELSDQFSKFILLSHAGFGVDQEIAREIPELDLIIGGHSHTPVIGGSYVDGNERTLITQAWEHGKLIGVVHLDFDDEGNIVQKTSQLVTLDSNFDEIIESLPASTVGDTDDILRFDVEEDPVVAEMLDDIQTKLEEELSVVIGSSDVHLDGERANVRTGETNLGNLITDAIRDYTNADVAFMNGGGIRASIESGDITVGDVMTVLPFINLVETVNIPGSVLLEALEHGASLYPEQNGALLHVSGMKYIVDATKESGSRVVYAEVGGEVLDPEKVYNVATNDFLIAGGDGYSMLEPYESDLVTGELFSDVLISYLQNQEGPIAPKVEGRMTFSDEALDDEALAALIAQITDGEVEETPETPEDPEDSEDSEGSVRPDLPGTVEDDDLQDLIDYLTDLFGKTVVNELLDQLTVEELMELVDLYEAKEEAVKEEAKAILEERSEVDIDDERLPDTATATWLTGLVGLVSLSSGLVLTKKKD